MMNDQKPAFDGRMIVALVLVAGFYFVWQSYLNSKYKTAPSVVSSPVGGAAVTSSEGSTANVAPTVPQIDSGDTGSELQKPQVEEVLFPFSSDRLSFQVSSQGMGLKNLTIKGFSDRSGQPILMGDKLPSGLFALLKDSTKLPVDFVVRAIENGFEGQAQNGETLITRTLLYIPEKGAFQSKVTVKNPDPDTSRGLSIVLGDAIHKPKKTSIFFPSYDHQDYFILFSGQEKSVNFSNASADYQEEFKNGSMVALGSQYFTAALIDHSPISPDVQLHTKTQSAEAEAYAIYRPSAQSNDISLEQTFYVGPKEINTLESVDPHLAQIMSFGYLSFIARPMLFVMKWFQKFVGNWGLAIILLTLMVRMLVLPVNILSFRSMKNMQKVQPLINEIRERYKDDPMQLQKQMMATMRENKANPFGGCLLMFLQIPIFFALYRVIGSSVELYQSPLGGWIHDLSLHDPIFILPVVMGILMFVQQKMTPTTMDPAQAKILAFMPLVFTAFMLYLPSGLALYMLVSTVFGISQQYLILGKNQVKAPAKA